MYVCQEGKPFVEVQYMGGKKVFSPEEVCMSVCLSVSQSVCVQEWKDGVLA